MKSTPRLPDESPNLGEQRPLREVAMLLATALLVVGAAALVLVWLADVLVVRIPVEREIAVFQPLVASMMEDLDDSGGDPAADAALREVFDRVAAAGPELPYAWAVKVICDDTPNALALAGGGVAVTSGLLHRLDDEAQLVFVLGHELGHFVHRDQLRGLGRKVALTLVLQGAFAMGGVGPGPALQAAMDAALGAHDRQQEAEADQVGLELLHATHGHVGGAQAVLEMLEEESGASRVDRLDFTRTHPVGEVRTAGLRQRVAREGWAVSGASRALDPALRAACWGAE